MTGTLKGRAIVAQGGGPTAVINSSVVGVVRQARQYAHINNIYGAIHGIQGIVEENFVDLTQTTTKNLEVVARTPSSALLSTRDKPDATYCERIFKVLKAHDIRYFFYIGGNDSADTCHIVDEQAQSAGYDLRVIHIPKTIDNDLRENDHTPGFGSAAKFVTHSFAGINLDNRALPGVYIGVVMGRNAGFLTAASAMAHKYPDDGPHLIYLPERAFNQTQFLSDVENVLSKHGRCIIAVSEGISDQEGTPVVAELLDNIEKDSHGNIQLSGVGALGDSLVGLVKKELKISRVRSDTYGYLQRSFLGCVSEIDRQEALEVGEMAVQFSAWNDKSGSVVIRRTGDYAVCYDQVPLENVARHTKHMPDEFISEENNFITEAFRKYAKPLIGQLPVYDRLYAPPVPKILNV